MFSTATPPSNPHAIFRNRLLLAASGSVLLAACIIIGIAAWQMRGRPSVRAGTTLAATTTGAVGQTATRDAAPASRQTMFSGTVTSSSLSEPQRGGYAEYLEDRQVITLAGETVPVRPWGGYAEFLHDHPAVADRASVRFQGTIAVDGAGPAVAPFGFAGDGRPLGGYAEWLQFLQLEEQLTSSASGR